LDGGRFAVSGRDERRTTIGLLEARRKSLVRRLFLSYERGHDVIDGVQLWPKEVICVLTWMYTIVVNAEIVMKTTYLGIQLKLRRTHSGRTGSEQNAPCAI
jgi:hypothetical protein